MKKFQESNFNIDWFIQRTEWLEIPEDNHKYTNWMKLDRIYHSIHKIMLICSVNYICIIHLTALLNLHSITLRELQVNRDIFLPAVSAIYNNAFCT